MDRDHYITDAKSMKGKKVKIAGWVHDVRDLGKLKFVHVRDGTGIMQVTMKKGIVEDSLLDSVDVNKEDIVSFEGEIKENKIAPDGVEMVPNGFRLLNRVGKKLPVDPTGHVPSDLDTRLDYRYIDLRKKDVNLLFRIKSSLITGFREYLVSEGFVEIHPSAITGAATEGGTEVFPVQYFETKAYLVQSPQLYKQLAVIGGLDRVMITMPVFRAEKHNTITHLNEITQMDIEMGFADHQDVMDVLEGVTLHMLKKTKKEFGEEIAEVFGKEAIVPKKVPRYTYSELVDKLNSEKFEMKFGEDFSKEAEKKISDILGDELYFIYDWPTTVRAFYSMPDEKNEEICHAFDFVYRGLEIASGAKRIHLVDILEKQLKKRGMNPANFEFYLNAFRMGAPPHSGWSIGLERFAMRLCNQENIREAMLFPRDRTRLSP